MSEPANAAGAATIPASPASAGTPPPKPVVVAPKPAAKPAPTRRFFFLLSWFAIGMIAMTASLLGMIAGTVRFLFPNVLSEPPSKFKAGSPNSYEDGVVVERYKDQNTWVVRHDGIIYALSTTCTHLGCTPNWLEREQKFKCPCHGSGFKITGVNYEGPAPRPLERWGIGVGDDGEIVVDKSKKFQQEQGQWDNPESFIKV